MVSTPARWVPAGPSVLLVLLWAVRSPGDGDLFASGWVDPGMQVLMRLRALNPRA
jgi:hypothetical protein